MSIKMIFASTAALALVAGTPALAAKNQNQQIAATEAGGGGVKAKTAKTCRFIDNSASRMKRQRLCYTREEWKKFDSAQ
ncbi:MAG TPA: hypothetical protein VGB04_08010 [Allosphingosinicella sp.]|jgi:hypothetical protein